MTTKGKHSIKDDFTMLALLSIPIAVAVNFVGSNIRHAISLPLFFDTIGTFFIAMLCGPWVGALTGLVTNLVLGITNPTAIAFAPVSIAVGLVAGFLVRAKMFENWWKMVISAILTALVSAVVSAPISVLMFSGVTSSADSLFAATLMASGVDIWKAVFSTNFFFSGLDRVLAILIARLAIKVLPARTLVKYSLGMNYVEKPKNNS